MFTYKYIRLPQFVESPKKSDKSTSLEIKAKVLL